ncbi:MAG: glycerophosphodiester phosphodiesterase family protein [Rothia sp. (in: high G+C Gram-positive bacteria)]|nr:glycerophosphodiester phosphodiesterase family protein [Rothia sp. (in: high G+C Gram-positive bacteria)]
MLLPHVSTPQPRPTLNYAHRGLAQHCAENTEQAFRQALAVGAHWIETDVHTSKDGQVIVFHDPTLERLAGRPEAVADLTWQQIKSIPLKEGGQIPRLQDILSAFPQASFNIDLKDSRSAEEIIPLLRSSQAAGRVRLASFSERALRAAYRRAQQAGLEVSFSASQPVSTLFYALSRIHPRLWSLLSPLSSRLLLPFDAIQLPLTHRLAGRQFQVIDRKLLAAAHQAGIAVHVWTVDDERTMRELIALGVDGIVSNRSDLLARLLAP